MQNTITLQIAEVQDAEMLTNIQIEAFEDHATVWGSWTSKGDAKGPGGYNSIQHVEYLIKVSNFFKIIADDRVVGGICAFIIGQKYGTIDMFFIHPRFKNKKIGKEVITLIEKQFPIVKKWDLGTSAKSKQNHYFYEKVGYTKIHKSEDYYFFEKYIQDEQEENTQVFKEENLEKSIFVSNQMSMAEFDNCAMPKAIFCGMNLEEAAFTNSGMRQALFNDVNLTSSRFHNSNLNGSTFGDINLNQIEICEAALGGAYFHDTNLGFHQTGEGMRFERCDLSNSKISDCCLQGAEIENCELKDMKINGICVEELLAVYEKSKNTRTVENPYTKE